MQEALKGRCNPMVPLLAGVDMSLTEAGVSGVFPFEKIPPYDLASGRPVRRCLN